MKSWAAVLLFISSLLATVAGGITLYFAHTRHPLPVVEFYAAITLACTAVGAIIYILSAASRTRQMQRNKWMSIAFEESADPAFIVNRKGKTVLLNKSALDFAKRTDPLMADLIQPFLLRGDSESEAKLKKMLESLMTLLPFDEKIPYQARDGNLDYLRIMTTPLPGEKLNLVKLASLGAQTSDGALDQDTIALFDALPVGFYVLNDARELVYINKIMANWIGIAPAHLISQNVSFDQFLTFKNTEDESLVRARLTAVNQRDITGTAAEVREGGIIGGIFIRDEGGGEDWQSMLRKSKVLFSRFFEEAPIGIVLVDLEGRITDSNRLFRDFVGGDKTGQAFSSCILDMDRPKLAAKMAEAISLGATSEPVEIMIEGERKTAVSLYVGRMEDEQDSVFGLMLHLIDVSEQKSLEEQFVQSQKMQAVGQLAGGVAHDFNNLLTAIIGYCDLLLERHRPGDPSFSDLNQIKQNSNRASNLVRQLLAFSRQQRLNLKPINLTDLLSDMHNMLDRLLGENIRLDMTHDPALWPIQADYTHMEQVILNLSVNARDAMNGRGTLKITTDNIKTDKPLKQRAEVMPPGEYVKISVKDSGSGIPPDIVERIFEPFFSTKDIGQGTGLGLSTVYGIVKQSRGFIFVESKYGHGATFIIYLPRYTGSLAVTGTEDNTSTPSADVTGTEVILFAEDEDPVRAFTTRALKNKGYEVLAAPSGEAALKLLKEHGRAVDLVISDVMMPGMDGPTFMAKIRTLYPDVPIICSSGYSEDATAEKLTTLEGIYFLAKPYSLNTITSLVRAALDHKAQPMTLAESADYPTDTENSFPAEVIPMTARRSFQSSDTSISPPPPSDREDTFDPLDTGDASENLGDEDESQESGDRPMPVILYAEDEAPVRTFTQRALEKHGFMIIPGDSGESALRAYKEYGKPVDMLLTDVMMPGMDGPTLIDEIRKLQPGIKILVVSGYAESNLRERVQNDQNLTFLPKPFSLKEIVAEVERILAG